jgi:hypothetical protein
MLAIQARLVFDGERVLDGGARRRDHRTGSGRLAGYGAGMAGRRGYEPVNVRP